MARRGRKRKLIDPWAILSSFLSFVFITIGVFLIFLAISEVIVYLVDSLFNGNSSYVDWWSTPLIMLVSSLPFFLGYLLVNLNRIPYYRRLKGQISIPSYLKRPDDDLDDLEID